MSSTHNELDAWYRSLRVDRVEVIDGTGRAYTNLGAHRADLQLQDGGRTLKVFVIDGQQPDPEAVTR